MSQDLDLQAIATSAGISGGGGSSIRFSSVETLTNITLPVLTPTVYILDGTNLVESESMYNSTTGEWTIPSDLVGTKMAILNFAAIGLIETATNNFTTQLWKNGTYYRQQGINASLQTDRLNMIGDINFPVQANDVILVKLVSESAQQVLGAGVGGNYASLIIFG